MKVTRPLAVMSAFSFALASFVPGYATPQAPAQPAPVNMNLSSTTASIASHNGGVAIRVGNVVHTVTPGQLLTPAEAAAVAQVLHSGSQNLQLGALGNAVGGMLGLGPGASQFSSFVIPKDVTVTSNLPASGILNITGALFDAGKLYAVATTSATTTATILANTITIAQGGLLSTPLNLSLVTAGGITNNGTIASTQGNINLSSTTGTLNINASGGTFSAPQGAITVGTEAVNTDINITGGDWLSKSLMLNAGQGDINAVVGQVTGTVATVANSEHFLANTSTLQLGTNCVTGDPLWANTGDIQIVGTVVDSNDDIAIVAGGDITADTNGSVVNSHFGGRIYLVAGAEVTSIGAPANSTTSGPPNTSATIDFVNAGGGNIDLTGSSVSSVVSSNGGNVFLIAAANANDGTKGNIGLNPNSLVSTSPTNPNNDGGALIIIAGGTGGAQSNIQLGNLKTDGFNAGSIVIVASQPGLAAGSSGTFSADGSFDNGFIGISQPSNAAISVVGNITMNGGAGAAGPNGFFGSNGSSGGNAGGLSVSGSLVSLGNVTAAGGAGGAGGDGTDGFGGDGGNGGTGSVIDIVATNGSLSFDTISVSGGASGRGGRGSDSTHTVIGGFSGTPGAGGTLSLSADSIQGNSVQLTGGSSGAGGQGDAGGGDGASGALAGTATLVAVHGVSVSTIDMRGGFGGSGGPAFGAGGGNAGTGGTGGNLTITCSAGGISSSLITASGSLGGQGGAGVAPGGGGTGGAGGVVVLSANQGLLNVDTITVNGGDGNMGGNSTSSHSGDGGNGGTVTATAQTYSLASISANGGSGALGAAFTGTVGGSGGKGGAISLRTVGSGTFTQSATISANGGNGNQGSSLGGSGGAGGIVSISSPRDISVMTVVADGGNGGPGTTGTSGDGALGGSISLNSTGGAITANGLLSAVGGGSGAPNIGTSGSGGAGGAVSLSAKQDIESVNGINVSGGISQGALAGGGAGNGGSISIQTGGAATLDKLFADGGDSFATAATGSGNGGSINIHAIGSALLEVNGASAQGGSLANGNGPAGSGGFVSVTAASIPGAAIIVSGGASSGSNAYSSAGGHGGEIYLSSGGVIGTSPNQIFLLALGGTGGQTGSATAGGKGGGGGSIFVNAMGDVVMDAAAAYGGVGGISTSAAAIGGDGGNGGIMQFSTTGSIIFHLAPDVDGGNGGVAASNGRSGDGGNGGTVNILTIGNIGVDGASSSGGNGFNGGSAGAFIANAQGVLTISQPLHADGGAGQSSTTGDGGRGGDGGNIQITGKGTTSLFGIVTANGGNGGNGGNEGGGHFAGSGGDGGSGGIISLTSQNVLSLLANVTANGGTGGNGGTGSPGGTGGNAGSAGTETIGGSFLNQGNGFSVISLAGAPGVGGSGAPSGLAGGDGRVNLQGAAGAQALSLSTQTKQLNVNVAGDALVANAGVPLTLIGTYHGGTVSVSNDHDITFDPNVVNVSAVTNTLSLNAQHATIHMPDSVDLGATSITLEANTFAWNGSATGPLVVNATSGGTVTIQQDQGNIILDNVPGGFLVNAGSAVISANGPSAAISVHNNAVVAIGSGGYGGSLKLTATGPMVFQGDVAFSANATSAAGSGGTIELMANGGYSLAGSLALSATGGATGTGGAVRLQNGFGSDTVNIGTGQGQISINASGGNGGSVRLESDSPVVINPSGLNFAPTAANGNGGNLFVEGSTVTPASGVKLTLDASANRAGHGTGGSLQVQLDGNTPVTIGAKTTDNFQLVANSGTLGGAGGTVSFSNQSSVTADGAGISANPLGKLGAGGTISLSASGGGELLVTGTLSANAKGKAAGGLINLTGGSPNAFVVGKGATTNGVVGKLSVAGSPAGSLTLASGVVNSDLNITSALPTASALTLVGQNVNIGVSIGSKTTSVTLRTSAGGSIVGAKGVSITASSADVAAADIHGANGSPLPINTPNVLTLQATTSGNLSDNAPTVTLGNVTSGTLTLSGTGTLVQSFGSTLSASTNLSLSGFKNIGSAQSALAIATPSLAVNKLSGAGFIANSNAGADLNLQNSTFAKLTLGSDANINIVGAVGSATSTLAFNSNGSNVAMSGGTLLAKNLSGSVLQLDVVDSAPTVVLGTITGFQGVNIATGTKTTSLQTLAGTTISSTIGSVHLQQSDLKGTIALGKGSTIATGTSVGGDIAIYIGTSVPASPMLGTAPAAVHAVANGAQIFFGTAGITAVTPTNNVTANNNNIIFDTGAAKATAIKLGGNVTIVTQGIGHEEVLCDGEYVVDCNASDEDN